MSPKPNRQCDVRFGCLNYFAGDMELGIEYFFRTQLPFCYGSDVSQYEILQDDCNCKCKYFNTWNMAVSVELLKGGRPHPYPRRGVPS